MQSVLERMCTQTKKLSIPVHLMLTLSKASLSDPDVACNLALPSSGEHPSVATRIASLTCPSHCARTRSKTSSRPTSKADVDGTTVRTTRRALSRSFSFDIFRSTICRKIRA